MNLQIQFPTTEGEPSLCVHADNGHGEIACGQRILDWTDSETGIRHQAVLTPVDKDVSCLKCQRVAEIPAALETVQRAEDELSETIRLVRADGTPWRNIAVYLGTTRQAAQERFADTNGEPASPGTPMPRHPVDPATRYVAFTSRGPDDLGGAQVTHADAEHCPAVRHFWGQYIRPATSEEIAKLRRCKRCG